MRPSGKKTRNTDAEHSVHGVLIDVYGVGVLMRGPSGIGKSECALDLIARGHRLVSDDLVLLRKEANGDVFGFPPEGTHHHLEVRGLGLLNIFHLYGAASVRDLKKIDMVLELVPFDEVVGIERVGIEVLSTRLMDSDLPWIRVPCWTGRNLTTIIEVAARNQILRWSGYDSALEFEKRHTERLCESS